MKKVFTLFAALMMIFSMNAAIYLPGSWNGWNQTGDAFSGTPLTSKITLAANTEYKFKVKDGSSWYGNNGKITSDVTNWTFSTSEGDCILQSKLAGVYTFTWDATNHKLSVAYPTEEVVVEYTYTIVGSSAALFGNTWDPSCTANDMTKDGATYTLTKTNITLAVGDVQYKVVREHAWGTGEYPSGTNKSFSITEAGVYDVTFTYDGGSNLTATPTLKEAQKVIPTVAVKGSWDEWTLKNLVLANDELTATATINIATVGDYKFGVDVDGVFTANGATVSRESNVVAGLTGNTGDMTLKADVAGEYTFTWTFETNTLTVTYPELPTYTVTVTAENGTVEGDGEYKEGTEVTLTATPAEGYQFVNWTVGEEVVSTDNPYSFVVTADVALVANFKKAVEEHTITLSGLLKYSNEFRGYTTLQNVEGDTAFFVYNYVDGVPAYGEGYSVTANLGDLTLEGTGSWKLIDELETITAVLYNEERTAVYNVTVSAKAPEVHNLTCTDALYVENISEWMSELTITGVIDEAALKISVYDWQEATAGTYYQVMGVLNDEVYIQPESAEVTIVDTKLTIAFSAVDEFGNTYNVNVTATPKPNTPLVVENATFTVDGDNLTIQGQWETKSVVVALVGWSTTKYGEYNAVLMTGTGEAEDDIYAEFSAVLSKDGTTATLTGVAVNWDGTKYDVTISGLAPAEAPTALDNVDTTVAPVKVIENGQLIIIRNGVQYNAQGAVVK